MATRQHLEYFSEAEQGWMLLYNDFLSRGYRLRARYHPDWIPSWEQAGISLEDIRAQGLDGQFEDSIPLAEFGDQAIDATRVIDGKHVWLKLVDCSPSHTELPILQTVSSDPRRDDPHNHCVTLLDVLHPPVAESLGTCVIVMPMYREWYDPAMHLVGEALDFIDQLLEGLAFMHQLNISHGDIKSANIMMDANDMYPDGFNPLVVGCDRHRLTLRDETPRGTRIEIPVKYVYIDFEHGHQFESFAARHKVKWTGGYEDLPETNSVWKSRRAEPFDPFPADIYALGELIRGFFLLRTPTLIPAIVPLVRRMVAWSPIKRPTAGQCLQIFRDAASSLSWSLCDRLPPLRPYTWGASRKEIRKIKAREVQDYRDRLALFLQVTDGQPRLLSQIPSRPAFSNQQDLHSLTSTSPMSSRHSEWTEAPSTMKSSRSSSSSPGRSTFFRKIKLAIKAVPSCSNWFASPAPDYAAHEWAHRAESLRKFRSYSIADWGLYADQCTYIKRATSVRRYLHRWPETKAKAAEGDNIGRRRRRRVRHLGAGRHSRGLRLARWTPRHPSASSLSSRLEVGSGEVAPDRQLELASTPALLTPSNQDNRFTD